MHPRPLADYPIHTLDGVLGCSTSKRKLHEVPYLFVDFSICQIKASPSHHRLCFEVGSSVGTLLLQDLPRLASERETCKNYAATCTVLPEVAQRLQKELTALEPRKCLASQWNYESIRRSSASSKNLPVEGPHSVSGFRCTKITQ